MVPTVARKLHQLQQGLQIHERYHFPQKIDSQLLMNYDHGLNLVKSDLSDCDRFEAVNDVLIEILPKLNINTAKCTKTTCPHYADMEDTNIYSYILAYN